MKPCGILRDIATTTTDGTTCKATMKGHVITEEQAKYIKDTLENYKSLETNYQNLLAEYEKLSEIAQGQAKIIAKYQKAEIEMLEGKKGNSTK